VPVSATAATNDPTEMEAITAVAAERRERAQPRRSRSGKTR
jgi:hypothetical protein